MHRTKYGAWQDHISWRPTSIGSGDTVGLRHKMWP